MPASKAEQVLAAIKALLDTVPDAVVERDSALPEKVPAGGLIILRDGDPGGPEQALGGFESPALGALAAPHGRVARGRRAGGWG
jgi:hypothetical protein